MVVDEVFVLSVCKSYKNSPNKQNSVSNNLKIPACLCTQNSNQQFLFVRPLHTETNVNALPTQYELCRAI